ncbi:TetR/AcrR family transcriptional regulator [Brevibacillus choshinensis]|uniref:TetR/AcrR family transcriptional regulator n=1 Tax=Brevibacillus choshinensis TaxID=54911 RepID=UPI002E1BD484|nr:TetR/AcrR family transcriptional regulator [Brevibacillus choshinensis]
MSWKASDRSVDTVGRQERKRLATRQNIYDTAIRLFRVKGYHATTVEEIATEADVAKATFFKHFPKKYELIEEIIKQRRDKVRAAATDEQVNQLSTKTQINHMMKILCQTIESDRALAVIALNEFICSGGLFKEEAPSIEIFYQTLERGKECGELRADIPTRVVARVLWSYYLESYIAWARNEQGQSLEAMLLEGVEVVFRGIEAGKHA